MNRHEWFKHSLYNSILSAFEAHNVKLSWIEPGPDGTSRLRQLPMIKDVESLVDEALEIAVLMEPDRFIPDFDDRDMDDNKIIDGA